LVLHPGVQPATVLRRAYPLIQGLNALGVAGGLLWYWPQLAHTSVPLLPFVPDCPLAAALLALALRGWRRGRGEALQGLAIGVALFYGAWTVALLWSVGAGDLLDRAMLFAHVGMAIEAVALWQAARPHRGWRLGGLWVALNTFVDYTLGTHPALPAKVDVRVVALATAAAAVLFVMAAPTVDPAP
jgi:uncharacterized membrane protein YpjA